MKSGDKNHLIWQSYLIFARRLGRKRVRIVLFLDLFVEDLFLGVGEYDVHVVMAPRDDLQ